MFVVSDVAELRRRIGRWKAAGERVGFVPTMGNLHAGHMSLVRLAQEHADRVIVSIYVNPLQFAPGEDYESYPRTEQEDRDRLVDAGADALFLPGDEEIYPGGTDAVTFVEVPGLSDILCGGHRQGHFRGVATIVAKLFNLVGPDLAVFGEKDYQQLLVIRRLAHDLCFPVEVISAPTHREADGLAMSSRNRYLDAGERAAAPALFQALRQTAAALALGLDEFEQLAAQGLAMLEAAGFRADYFEIRDAGTLGEPTAGKDLVVMAAAWLGRARLIDNLRVEAPG
jgi:pantoate--beta-alanine ligase